MANFVAPNMLRRDGGRSSRRTTTSVRDNAAMTYALEAIGWIGAVLVLAAYALLSTGRLQGNSPLYQ